MNKLVHVRALIVELLIIIKFLLILLGACIWLVIIHLFLPSGLREFKVSVCHCSFAVNDACCRRLKREILRILNVLYKVGLPSFMLYALNKEFILHMIFLKVIDLRIILMEFFQFIHYFTLCMGDVFLFMEKLRLLFCITLIGFCRFG